MPRSPAGGRRLTRSAAFDEQRFADEGVAHPGRHQRQHLALRRDARHRPGRNGPQAKAAIRLCRSGPMGLAESVAAAPAPMPVSERTCCARKPALSALARACFVEHREQPDADEADGHREQRRAGVREPGRALGIAQRGFPHPRATPPSAPPRRSGPGSRRSPRPRRAALPQHAHQQHRKLAEAAMAKARLTMKAMFCFSKAMPSTTATMPSAMVVIFETRSSAGAVGLAFL